MVIIVTPVYAQQYHGLNTLPLRNIGVLSQVSWPLCRLLMRLGRGVLNPALLSVCLVPLFSLNFPVFITNMRGQRMRLRPRPRSLSAPVICGEICPVCCSMPHLILAEGLGNKAPVPDNNVYLHRIDI